MSLFDKIEVAPADPILGVTTAFNNDTSDKKVNLGVGAYRDDSGKPWVLPVVRKVEKQMAENPKLDKEYLPIDGLQEFTKLTAKLILGENSPALKDNRVATVQSLSGTGALRLFSAFIKRFFPADVTVYIPDPTWGNHNSILKDSGLPFKTYRYFDDKTKSLNFNGLMEDFKAAPNGSVMLLHVCAHNPTGVDPTQDQWKSIASVMKERKLFPFFDCAYQGFASGDLDRDAFAVRHFVDQGFELAVTQSYAKNLGLYAERVGALNVVTDSQKTAEAVKSQLKLIIRAMYSNPPVHGAKLVASILGDKELYNEWLGNLVEMANRIKKMRQVLFDRLKANGTPGTWNHIVDQIGMFSYTGLNPAQVKVLTEKYHVYLLSSGRISMAGLNSGNVEYFADAIKDAVTSASAHL